MYGEIVDMDILFVLVWLYQLPFQLFALAFNLGFWGVIIYFIYSSIRDFWIEDNANIYFRGHRDW